MSNPNLALAMHLTLTDAASGPLRGVVSMLEQLQALAGRLTPQMNAFAGSITKVNAELGATRAAAQSAAQGIGSVGQRASSAVGGTYALEQALGALGGNLSRMTAQLTAAAAGLTGLAGAQGAANAAAQTGAGHLNAAGTAAQGANAQVSTLATTLKGMAQLWGALKIEKGLTASAEHAIEYQNTQTRMQNMNLSAGEQAEMIHAADSTARAVPQFNRNQTLEMGIDLRNATGSVEHALEMLTPFAVAAYDMKMATPRGQTFNERDMLLIAKALEQRNATMDPAKMQAELDMITKIYAATQGRVDANQILGNLQYSKGGLGQSMDITFLPMLAAMIEQIKSGGGNGGQIGTSLTSLQQSIINGTGNGQAQKERARLGLVDPDKLVWNKQGNIDQQKSNLRMAGAEEFQRNPYEWVQNYLKPAMIRAGIDLTNDAAVNQTLNKLFPNRNAANIASTMINRGPLLEKDAANINQTAGGAEQYRNNIKTAQANIDAFKAQITNLGIVLGTTLLPAVTAVAHIFTSMFQGLAAFFQAFPATATFVTYALAIGSVVLAVRGFMNVFGIIGTLTTLLRGIGPAAATSAAEVAAASATTTAGAAATAGRFAAMSGIVGTVLSFLGKSLLKLIPYVGLLMVAWDLAPLIGNIEVGGQKISAWAGDIVDWVVDKFRAGWRVIGQIVNSVIPGAMAAGRVGAGGPDRHPDRTGSWDAPEITAGGGGNFKGAYHGTSGSWGDDPKVGAGLFNGTSGPGGGGRGGRDEPALGAIQGSGQAQYKADFLRSEKAVYGDLAKIEADIEAETDKRKKAALQAERDRLKSERDEYVLTYGRIADVRQDYADKVAEINDLERNGMLSTSAAEAQKLALLKDEAVDLDVIIEKLRQMPGGTDKDDIALDKLSRKNRTTQGMLDPDTVVMLKTAQSGFGDLFKNIFSGSMTAAQAFRKFGQSVLDTMTNIISKRLGDALFDSLFGGLLNGGGGGAGGGGGGWLGSLFGGAGSWLSGLFGGGPSSAVLANAAAPSLFASLPLIPFADGTDRVPRDMLAMIHADEKITPAAYNPDNPNNRLGSGGGANPVSVTNNISVGAGVTRGDVMALMQGYGASLKGEILGSIRNGGVFARGY